jgi:hypothetical protein
MGIGTESATLNQLKKAQGETNERLEALIAEQKRTNELLSWLVQALQHSLQSPQA